MTWFFLLPNVFLLLIILLYAFGRKKNLYTKLKSFFPFLFTLFILSLGLSILKSDFISHLFYSEILITILELGLLFFIMTLVIKGMIVFIFDFFMEKKQNLKYPRLIKDVLVIILYIVGILLIAKYYLNIQLTVVLASSAVLTVVVGFALQDILGDLFSGIALNLEESLKIGDWIKIGMYEGQIEQFRWRAIKIRTNDNILVLIPNRIASKEEIKRFGSDKEPFSLRLKVGVSYKHSPDLVIDTVMAVLRHIPEILTKPESLVMVEEFADFAVIYEIKFWIADYSIQDPLKSEIHRKIWYAFRRKNIQIPFPIRDIYIKDFKKESSTGLPQWAGMNREQVIEILRRNEVLNTISKEQLENLAENVEVTLFGKDDILIREGEEGRYFYQLLEGQAEVFKDGKVIFRLDTGDYVGEMSLFTGEKTSADVRILKESRFLRISSDKFKETVRLNEKMARKLSEVIAHRKTELKELRKKKENLSPKTIKKESENIFLRIKKYFSL